ncbi:hypothetical protein [Litchfieldia alkalitelluris]|uniref:hypothetical protein n=1 Tax=Litchfieldia alkalitelluris TaxID=304268 RepID=UPI0009984D6F|nr:hypothetical protein [Litchfieldia alkalitelluris]
MNGLDEKLDLILNMAQELIGTRTMFISRTGNDIFSVLRAQSNNGSLIKTGDSIQLNHAL